MTSDLDRARWLQAKELFYLAMEAPVEDHDAILMRGAAHDRKLLAEARGLLDAAIVLAAAESHAASDRATEIRPDIGDRSGSVGNMLMGVVSDRAVFLDPGLDGLSASLFQDLKLPHDGSWPAVIQPLDRVLPFSWGPLEVREQIGSGSFGEVYRAFDSVLERDVALKLRRWSPSAMPPPPALAIGTPSNRTSVSGSIESESGTDPTADSRPHPVRGSACDSAPGTKSDPVRGSACDSAPGTTPDFESHLEEARRLARVRHPNVLAVHGVETHDGAVGIWTDLVRGETLERALERTGPFAGDALVRSGVDLCRALGAVHGAGIIHGDVKTANAMRDLDGRVILMDFGAGVSSLRQHDAQTSYPNEEHSDTEHPQVRQATPVAMAPELFDTAPPSVATDIYALGVLLYRLATGRYPFRGSSIEELRARLTRQELVPLFEIRPDLSVAFARVVHRTLAPRPEDRPHSTQELEWLLAASLGAVETNADEIETPQHLPHGGHRFIGRAKELSQLRSLLTGPGLVTVVGPGGSGKTRLAQRLAPELNASLQGGTNWVDLAVVRDPRLVPTAIARSLNLRDEPERSLVALLQERVGDGPRMLVLDNAEHVREAVREVVAELLGGCPQLHLLVTSRVPLGVVGERVFRLVPMSVPEERDGGEGLEILEFDAVRLFLDRVQRGGSDLVVTAALAPTVARVVRCLDGIPLALELAAARVGAMGLEELATRLEKSIRVLATREAGGPARADRGSTHDPDRSSPDSRSSAHDAGSSTRVPRRSTRQQTLSASIAWSYDLLEPEEATLFARLAVFAGGWTIDAAEAICSDPGSSGQIGQHEVIDLLANLFDQSLVQFEEQAMPAARYRFLESVRFFALQKIQEREKLQETSHQGAPGGFQSYATLRDRHLAWLLRTCRDRGLQINGAEGATHLAFFEVEYANVLAALEWARQSPGDPMRGVDLCLYMGVFWHVRGHFREGLVQTCDALSRAPQTIGYVRSLLRVASYQSWLGDLALAETTAREALALARELGEDESLSLSLSMVSHVLIDRGALVEARPYLEEAIRIRGGIANEVHLISLLCNAGVLAGRLGDLAEAAVRYTEALAIARARGDDHSTGHILCNLATTARLRGQPDDCRVLAQEASSLLRRSTNRVSLWLSLKELAYVAIGEQDFLQARTLLLEGLTLTHRAQHSPGFLELLAVFAEYMFAQSQSEGVDFEKTGSPARLEDVVSLFGHIAAARDTFRTAATAATAATANTAAAASTTAAAANTDPRQEARDLQLKEVRDILGDQRFSAAWARGRARTSDEVLAWIERGA